MEVAKHLHYIVLSFLLVSSCLIGTTAISAEDIPICVASRNQSDPRICPDGNGGAFVLWLDSRQDSINHLYLQRLNASGAPAWTANGILVAARVHTLASYGLVSDGEGGAIIAWQDQRNDASDIYAQRVAPNGTMLWTTGGVAVSVFPGDQISLSIIPDGTAGAIVTWEDHRYSLVDIYAQRISSAGTSLWRETGIQISQNENREQSPKIVPADSSGAIIFWTERIRSGEESRTSVRAQRASADGELLWQAEGVEIIPEQSSLFSASVTSDSAGGALVTWLAAELNESALYTQRVLRSGKFAWRRASFVSSPAGFQFSHAVTPGVDDDYFVAYQHSPEGNGSDIFVKRFNLSFGGSSWSGGAVIACSADGNQGLPQLIADESGGVFVSWEDERVSGKRQIYAQHISAEGEIRFEVDGSLLFEGSDRQSDHAVIGGQSESAIIAWTDSRKGDETDIYAGQIFYPDFLAHPVVQFRVTSGWNMLSLPLTVTDLRAAIVYPSAISPAFVYENGYRSPEILPYGLGYWLKFPSNATLSITGEKRLSDTVRLVEGWNMIGSISASVLATNMETRPPGLLASSFFAYEEGYTVADTVKSGQGYWIKSNGTGDLIFSASPGNQLRSVGDEIEDGFMNSVVLRLSTADGKTAQLKILLDKGSHQRGRAVGYELPPAPPGGMFDVRFSSGQWVEAYSNENVNPSTFQIDLMGTESPITLTAETQGSVADIRLSASTDNTDWRPLVLGTPLTFSGELTGHVFVRAEPLTGKPETFSLSQNFPNPFNPSTSIMLSLLTEARIELAIFNTLGMEVIRLADNEFFPSGTHMLKLSGSDLPSGVYYYRITATDLKSGFPIFGATKEMVIIR